MDTTPDWLPLYRTLVWPLEGCKLQAYPDPKTGGAPWTIGRGHTGPEVHQGLVWAQQQADDTADADAMRFGALLDAHVTVPLTPQMKAALVSILENVGPGSASRDGIIRLKGGEPSTLLHKLNAGDYQGCCDEFMEWVSPGSSVQHGLTIRRRAECAMFISGGVPDA